MITHGTVTGLRDFVQLLDSRFAQKQDGIQRGVHQSSSASDGCIYGGLVTSGE